MMMEEKMNELMDRLKMYEPLFGQWKVDFYCNEL